jgi:hypothetical protein
MNRHPFTVDPQDIEPGAAFTKDLATTVSLEVGGRKVMCHLDFFAVKGGHAIEAATADHLCMVAELCGVDPTELQTITIGRQQYVPVLVPFAK